jgi:hypothetical protein
MNREQAKVWAKLTPEDLRLLGYTALAEHYEILKAYADGKTIQHKHISGEWSDTKELHLYSHKEYRVKPDKYTLFGIVIEGEVPLKEPPNIGDTIYVLNLHSSIGYIRETWVGINYDKRELSRGFIFKTEEGARTAAKALGLYDVEVLNKQTF